MPTDPPPAYSKPDLGPAVNVTHPEGDTINASADSINQRPGHKRSSSNASNASSLGTNLSDFHDPNLVDDEGKVDMDDERRDLPQGWIRCFDTKTQHHFYVEEATKRSTWLHPYDDPEYLRTLPDSHPAHPNSIQAQNMRKRAEDEALMAKKMSQKGVDNSTKNDGKRVQPGSGGAGVDVGAKDNDEERNWFQKKKDKVFGTKEEREKIKAEKRKIKAEQEKKYREAQEAYLKRRQELINQQLDKQRKDPNYKSYYASDPYAYSAPTTAFSRAGGMYDSPYGYGYGGGYGRRYRPGYGYGTGYGMPLMLGGGAGLLGGVMMADALSGPGMGMGMGMGGLGMGGMGMGGFGGGGFGGGFDGGGMGGGGGFGC